MKLARAIAVVLVSTATIGCSESGARVEEVVGPYSGTAYPNRRTPITYPASGTGVVTNSLSDTLALIDRSTGQPFASYPVGLNPVDIDGPHHVAVDVPNRAAYVALSYPAPPVASLGVHASHGSSTKPGYVQKLSLDDLRPLAAERIDPNPGDIVVSKDGSRIVVSHFNLAAVVKAAAQIPPPPLDSLRSNLITIDAATFDGSTTPTAHKLPLCAAAHGVALSADGNRAWVACFGEDSVAVVDLANQTVIERTPVGPDATPLQPTYGPYAAVLSPDATRLAVSCNQSTAHSEVRIFDVTVSPIALVQTIVTDGLPFFPAWTPDGSKLYVPTQSVPPEAVTVYETATWTQIDRKSFTTSECQKPHEVNLATDGLWVVCEGIHDVDFTPGTIVRLDVAPALSTATVAQAGLYPDKIVLLDGGSP